MSLEIEFSTKFSSSPTRGAPTPSSRRGGSGGWYAMELTELLPRVARQLNINWDGAIPYVALVSSE